MKNQLYALFFLGVLLLSAFAFYGTAKQDPNPLRTPVPVQGPDCDKKDKGDCQAVCNVEVTATGEPDPVGCVNAFLNIPKQSLCNINNGESVYLVGCDMPSNSACTSLIEGKIYNGVWCNCYYRCTI